MTRIRKKLPLNAMILVGGLGTRLRSVVGDRPKPMALVMGVPFLEILLRSLYSKGVSRFVLLTGFMSDFVERHFLALNNEFDVTFSIEHEPLGTGGAVRHALNYATDPTLLVNGDTFLDADLERLMDFHVAAKADATLSLLNVPDISRYGSVEVNDLGEITAFLEKKNGPPCQGLINGGVSLLSREFIEHLPETAFSMERDIFPALVGTGKLYGCRQDADFFDIGTPESYREFEEFVSRIGLSSLVRSKT